MNTQLKTAAVCLLGAVLVGGCATRGQLRRGLEEQRTALEAQMAAERTERTTAISRLEGDISTLRTDLQGLRTEFGARIDSLQAGMQFALPIHFAFNEATVDDADRAALDRFAQVIQRHYSGATVTVEGFADPAGGARYNQRLSQRRAEAVRDYLVTRGIADTQLRAIGYGEARPVVRGAAGSEAGAEMNRRVVFVVESGSTPMSGAPMGESLR